MTATLLPIPQKEYSVIYEDTISHRVILGSIDEILEVDPGNLLEQNGVKGISYIAVIKEDGEMHRINPGEETGTLTLPYGGNLSLVISSLDYSPQTVHRYMYKLAKSLTDTAGNWSVLPEGVNSIMLSDLKMGNFELLVKRVGMPDAPAVIPITVKAPLWLQWWAILLYVVLLAAVVWAIVYYYRRKAKRQEQIRERKEALENAERKLTFLSNISHDLKTPLSMIIGPVSILKEQTNDDDTRRQLDMVYNNAMRLNTLIHRTIELRHLEDADDTLLILSTFDAVEFCRSVFETFRDNHAEKNFVFHASCSGLYIKADAVKFESVITNLLSNACKYSAEGATISCGVSSRDNNLEIIVSDDGIGIDEIDQPLVFQRMFRAPSSAGMHEGTGLGLYLIKRYLELMEGTINMYSRKGQGTSFIITLPLSAGISDNDKSTVSKMTDVSKPKILIVEDNDEIAVFIESILSKEYTVLRAENGRSGLAIASSFLPDLIIVDEMMPIMTGIEMCHRLKQTPRLNSIPLVMLTAKSDSITENESIREGIDVFMSKPFEPEILKSRIRQLLKSRDDIRQNIRIEAITETKPIEAESVTEKQLAKIAKIVEDNISDPDLNVSLLCEKSGMPQKQLYRIIKKYMGVSPLDYIRGVRLQKAALLLSQKRFTVSEICYMVGFKNPSYFAKCFSAYYGMSPGRYADANGNAGE